MLYKLFTLTENVNFVLWILPNVSISLQNVTGRLTNPQHENPAFYIKWYLISSLLGGKSIFPSPLRILDMEFQPLNNIREKRY